MSRDLFIVTFLVEVLPQADLPAASINREITRPYTSRHRDRMPSGVDWGLMLSAFFELGRFF